jgi:hypothetical protein
MNKNNQLQEIKEILNTMIDLKEARFEPTREDFIEILKILVQLTEIIEQKK